MLGLSLNSLFTMINRLLCGFESTLLQYFLVQVVIIKEQLMSYLVSIVTSIVLR